MRKFVSTGYALYGQPYTFRISRMFLRNTPQNMKHSLYTFRISCEFRVLLMPRKNKPRNPLTFRANANPGAKCCEMRKAKKGTQNTKKNIQNTSLYTFCSSHFAIVFAHFAISDSRPKKIPNFSHIRTILLSYVSRKYTSKLTFLGPFLTVHTIQLCQLTISCSFWCQICSLFKNSCRKN